jgi:hypothetical protein
MRILLCLLALVVPACYAAMCHGGPSPDAKPNMLPILDSPPVFVSQVKNAKLYNVGSGDDVVPLVHLWGTPYEKGYAHGLIMKDKMTNFIDDVWTYLEEQVEEALNGSSIILPPDIAKWVADVGLDVALDITSDETAPYTGQWFFDEMHGMADSTGGDYDKIRRVHMIGELTKGGCSMFGAWGTSLANQAGMVTMRALDWDIDGPFKNYPELTVYHPQDGSTENTFVNIGWTGWVGSISGVNDAQMSIHEIGVSFPDDSFGNESSSGVPFTHVLRDILQFDHTQMDGLSRLASSHRTCDLIMGVGGGKDQKFNSVEYSASICRFISDTDFIPVADWHPPLENVVYHGMDWLCPTYSKVLNQQLSLYHGKLTPEVALRYVMSIVQTGDLHVYVIDLTDMQLYVAHARADGASGNVKAFDRSYLKIDMPSVWAVTKPAL